MKKTSVVVARLMAFPGRKRGAKLAVYDQVETIEPMVPKPGIKAAVIARDLGPGILLRPHERKNGPRGTTPVKQRKQPAYRSFGLFDAMKKI